MPLFVSVSCAFGSIMGNVTGDSNVQDLLDFTALERAKPATKYPKFIWNISSPYVRWDAGHYLLIKFSIQHQKKKSSLHTVCIEKEGKRRLIMN